MNDISINIYKEANCNGRDEGRKEGKRLTRQYWGGSSF